MTQSNVEKALKLGYPEELTRRALEKVGLSGCQVTATRPSATTMRNSKMFHKQLSRNFI